MTAAALLALAVVWAAVFLALLRRPVPAPPEPVPVVVFGDLWFANYVAIRAEERIGLMVRKPERLVL